MDMSTMNIRVFNSKLSSTETFVNVEIESGTTVSDIVKEALAKFELSVSVVKIAGVILVWKSCHQGESSTL